MLTDCLSMQNFILINLHMIVLPIKESQICKTKSVFILNDISSCFSKRVFNNTACLEK